MGFIIKIKIEFVRLHIINHNGKKIYTKWRRIYEPNTHPLKTTVMFKIKEGNKIIGSELKDVDGKVYRDNTFYEFEHGGTYNIEIKSDRGTIETDKGGK